MFALLLTIFSLASVSAVTVNSSVSFSAAGYNYTTTSLINPTSITANETNLYLSGLPYCATVYTSFFTTTVVCAESEETLQETLEEIREDARNKNTIIFSAFSLLALAILITAGVLISKSFESGEVDLFTVTILIVSAIGLTIIIFVGMFVLSTLANTI